MRERQQKKQGLTLAELVMAMAITTIIGLTVAGVASALSHAYAHSEDYFESLQTARVSSIRLQRTINSSLLITAVDSEGLVLWEYDSNGNGKINLSEICIIEYDSDTKKLRTGSIRYPAGMDPSVRDGLDMTVPLYRLTDRIEAKSLLSGESYYKEQPLATNVQGFSISGNRSAPMTTMV
ncbi:MAG: type II secretion system protein J, partial [Phycisphaerae bacterium]